MKRDFKSLLHERTEGEMDVRKRRRLESEDLKDERAERVERANQVRVKQMRDWMKKWEVLTAQSASDYNLEPPAPNPLGATSPCFLPSSSPQPCNFAHSSSHVISQELL
jgi:hypothetical protein